MNKVFNPLLNETFVFRPLQTTHYTLRYADGQWLPDDGETFDLAFIDEGLALYVHLPNYSNLLWSWTNKAQTRQWLPEHLKQFNNQNWHYMTIDNTPLDDEYSRFKFPNDDTHPNAIAGRSAIDKCCQLFNCASGHGPNLIDATKDDGRYIKSDDYISRGLLRIQRTNEPIVIPHKLTCYLCENNGKGHLLEALKSKIEDVENSIVYSQEQIDKWKSNIDDEEYDINNARTRLEELKKELKEVER